MFKSLTHSEFILCVCVMQNRGPVPLSFFFFLMSSFLNNICWKNYPSTLDILGIFVKDQLTMYV